MGQVTIQAIGTYGSTTLNGTVTIEADGIHTGTLTVTNSYVDIVFGSGTVIGGTPQAVLINNVGTVDVSVRLQYSSTKYGFLNCPPNAVLCIPMGILDTATVQWDALAVKTLSGTADINYCVIR